MLRLPHANATITKVTDPGSSDDWDDAATTGPTRWEGKADAFVRDTRRREINDGRTDFVDVRTVSLPEGVSVAAGCTLTLTYRGAQLVVPVLTLVAHTAPPGVPGGSVVEVEPS